MTNLSLQIDLLQVFALLGLAQSVYVLVYIALHARFDWRVAIPFVYVMALVLGFLTIFAKPYLAEGWPLFDLMYMAVWIILPILSVLLIAQLAKPYHLPPVVYFFFLLVPVLVFAIAPFLAGIWRSCADEGMACDSVREFIRLSGFLTGALAYLSLWFRRGLFSDIRSQPSGKERYWICLMLSVANIMLLGFALLYQTEVIASAQELDSLRLILSLLIVYLAGTSLLRVYPQPIEVRPESIRYQNATEETEELAANIRNLLDLDKVYQEPGYGRRELAQELGVSESDVSRAISLHFDGTLPQILNRYRVEDAKRLLTSCDAPVSVIAEQVGFNSATSFNRCFRDETGLTASEYRQKNTQ